ncbi:hypothetical protein CDL15_Pgr029103 [Punica granatum]|uniref:Uncharacterized protein n=1 Tax=Punica granatum TaxID=22663 RepID=A0A218XLM4_PUNGR|nr:hypothetical protein CDL15_Pgr029103 [Punica granatum]
MVSNNDYRVWDFDMERFTLCKHFEYPWPVNCSCLDGPVSFNRLQDGFEEQEEIDFFGEISGISFSPGTESLTYGSLLQHH